ncbi:MAG: hypothetical protein QNJ15_13470 [Erythrobacter sp.]|nr:hypothetical protein [Erythrobacter sp.]
MSETETEGQTAAPLQKSIFEHVAQILKWGASALIVFSYIGVVIWLLAQLGDLKIVKGSSSFSEQAWDQITHLLTALGALVTTAAGVLIGVQVQQGSVDNANKRAAKSEADAAKAEKQKKIVKDRVEATMPKIKVAKSDMAVAATEEPNARAAQQVLSSVEKDLRAALAEQ